MRTLLGRNVDLLRNAGSLAATTGLTSLLGFAYWIYAAHVFTPDAVGEATAAISTMTLLGTVGMFGLGTMLIGELPRGGNRGGLVAASLLASFIGSAVLGLGFAICTLAFGSHFAEINGTFARMIVFSLGVAVTGFTSVFDESTIGLMRGGLQLSRNVAVSIAKMAALPVTALFIHDAFGLGIMFSWVLSMCVSVVPVAIKLTREGGRLSHHPDWAKLWQLRKVTLAHNWLNLAIVVPTKLMPVLVLLVVSPTANAAYYVAAMMASFLAMVPFHLSTVLFAIASAAPKMIAEKLRFVLRMSLVIGIPAGLALGVCAHVILSVFGSSYASLATGPLWLMIAAYIPNIPNTVYIAVCRATGKLTRATIFLGVFALIQMASVLIGGKIDGLYGLSYGQLIVAIVEALITTPAVLRTAFGGAPVGLATGPVTAGQARLRDADLAEQLRQRQEAGLNALISLATTVGPGKIHPALQITREQPYLASDVNRFTSAGPEQAEAAGAAGAASIDTTWWPDPDEATFTKRQEAGMAALIAIATHASKF